MSVFLEDLKQWLEVRDHHILRVAELCGQSEEAEVLELNPATPCQNIYSIAKVFTVTAVGMLVDRGLLSTEETIPEALGAFCPQTYDPRWKETTVHMVLRHHVGLEENCLDIDAQDGNDFGSDYLQYVLHQPLAPHHGTERVYTDAAYYLLSCIVENCAGMPLDDFLWRELFGPMRFRDAAWSHCPMGHAMGATGLYLRITDMIKLGSLYMNGGLWQGRRLLSQRWVQTVLENEYELTPRGFGLAYGKGGMLGQKLIVIPEAQRVVAWSAADGEGQEDLTQFVCEYGLCTRCVSTPGGGQL